MSEHHSKAVNKMADRIVKGYGEVHNKNYAEAKELLEPLVPLFHHEDKPNLTLLAYTSMAQIGTKDIDGFLSTYEELKKYEPSKKTEVALVQRVDEMFEELLHAVNDEQDKDF